MCHRVSYFSCIILRFSFYHYFSSNLITLCLDMQYPSENSTWCCVCVCVCVCVRACVRVPFGLKGRWTISVTPLWLRPLCDPSVTPLWLRVFLTPPFLWLFLSLGPFSSDACTDGYPKSQVDPTADLWTSFVCSYFLWSIMFYKF